VLEYLVGVDLQRYAQERRHLAEFADHARRVSACAPCARNIVHRDLKPSNVFLRLQMAGTGEEFTAALRDPPRRRSPRRCSSTSASPS
jgi:hypothetical protein